MLVGRGGGSGGGGLSGRERKGALLCSEGGETLDPHTNAPRRGSQSGGEPATAAAWRTLATIASIRQKLPEVTIVLEPGPSPPPSGTHTAGGGGRTRPG